MSKIHLVLASDNNYAQHLGISIISILENNNEANDINFHILENGISKENKEKIISLKNKYTFNINFYNIEESQLDNLPEIGHLTKATYSRLLIPKLLPKDIDRVIYLDCDLVALKDLKKLYQIDLASFPLAAVEDVKSKEIIRVFFCQKLNSYFNAGVMLIDLNKWRDNNISEKAFSFVQKHISEIKTADQDVLNCLFNNNWKRIDSSYNLDMKHKPINSLPKENTVILHYSDQIKPWSYLYVGKNKKYYFKYLTLSPWKDFEYQDKNLKNFFKKYYLALKKELKNKLRKFIPKHIIDWHKRRFLRNKI